MKTSRKNVKVSEIFEGYQDMNWEGVVGYGGKLDIRPAYQREFIYETQNEQAVIATVLKGHPLNIMYWVQNGNGNFELLDGQQRTLSICRYLDHKYYIINKDGNKVYIDTMFEEERRKIMDYELDICVCEGTESEVLDWFKTINIKGKELNEQEALNATHTGKWLSDAKRYFSKPNCAAYGLGKDYIVGAVERQDYLATVLKWISSGDAQGYMAIHRNNTDASGLWDYFQSVIKWVKFTFPYYRHEMKGVNWGELYNEFNRVEYDSEKLEMEVSELMQDYDVTKKSGIYPYVLTREEKYLSIRAFDDKMKREAYERQKGICLLCNKHYDITEMEADHITPWVEGGPTISENCQMLCRDDNRRKGMV